MLRKRKRERESRFFGRKDEIEEQKREENSATTLGLSIESEKWGSKFADRRREEAKRKRRGREFVRLWCGVSGAFFFLSIYLTYLNRLNFCLDFQVEKIPNFAASISKQKKIAKNTFRKKI